MTHLGTRYELRCGEGAGCGGRDDAVLAHLIRAPSRHCLRSEMKTSRHRQEGNFRRASIVQLRGSDLQVLLSISTLSLRMHIVQKQVPFSMAIGNVDLLHECFPKHQRIGTARIK